MLVVGKKWFEKLTPEQQQIIREASDIAKQYMRDAVLQDDAEALEEIKAAGVQVTELTPENKAEIRKVAYEEVEKQANKVNAKLFAELNKAIEEAKAEIAAGK